MTPVQALLSNLSLLPCLLETSHCPILPPLCPGINFPHRQYQALYWSRLSLLRKEFRSFSCSSLWVLEELSKSPEGFPDNLRTPFRWQVLGGCLVAHCGSCRLELELLLVESPRSSMPSKLWTAPFPPGNCAPIPECPDEDH